MYSYASTHPQPSGLEPLTQLVGSPRTGTAAPAGVLILFHGLHPPPTPQGWCNPSYWGVDLRMGLLLIHTAVSFPSKCIVLGCFARAASCQVQLRGKELGTEHGAWGWGPSRGSSEMAQLRLWGWESWEVLYLALPAVFGMDWGYSALRIVACRIWKFRGEGTRLWGTGCIFAYLIR